MEAGQQYLLNIKRPLHLSNAILCLENIPSNCIWDCFIEVHAVDQENRQDHLIGIIGCGVTTRSLEPTKPNPVSIQCTLNLKLQPTPPVALYIQVIGIPYYNRPTGVALFGGKELGKQKIAVQVTGYFD